MELTPLKVPAPQGLQGPDGPTAYVPALHPAHVVSPLRLATVPGAHATHAAVADTAAVPDWHVVQADALPRLNSPGLHSVHCVALGEENVPGAQATQAVALVSLL